MLADFEHYADWNPLNIEASGEPEVGEKVRMRFVNAAKRGATVRQTVAITRSDPGRALSWRGHIPLLFTREHVFKLSRQGDGTRLLHNETLSGLLVLGISGAQIADEFVPLYEEANRALAARLSAIHTVGG